MAANTKIEWTHRTFNPWWGCRRVSAGCDNCYAAGIAHRFGHDIFDTGRTFGDAHWADPLKWDAKAWDAGRRERVFPSMCDPFDKEAPREERAKLWDTIGATRALDWLLLTKRPKLILDLLPEDLIGDPRIWLGTSIESQEQLIRGIYLLAIPARVRFLSLEPLLGPVDVPAAWLTPKVPGQPVIHWVIVGGESGPGARPMHPDWARSLRDQCVAANTAFFFKQWGAWAPSSVAEADWIDPATDVNSPCMKRVGKKAAGRLLDGRTWDEMPAARALGAEKTRQAS